MKDKFYITTAIDYVNANPHIGHALEKIQADVLARYYRGLGKDVFFLTGTDEHGVKIARAAESAGKTPEELVSENSEKFRALKEALNLSWDNFIRTSDQKIHWPVAQELWKRMEKSGDLHKKTYDGMYCVGCEAFITKKDLEGGKCAIHKKEPEIIKEENWFFNLKKYSLDIKKAIESDELKIVPATRKNEVLAFLKEGLEDISFSRPSKDLSWGVPVPGDDSQTMYVWADALSNYISGYGGISEWEKHSADIHLIGKDILRFHAIIWSAMLLSAGFKLPKAVFVHGHILSGGEKMSKSLGNVIDPFELVKKYGVDAARYFLLREIPSCEDGDFTYEKFEERYNGDLANGLGNFSARVLTLATDPSLQIASESTNVDKNVEERIKETKESVSKKIQEFKLNEALEAIWNLVHFGDQYVNEKKPWEQKSEKLKAESEKTIYNLVIILNNIADLLLPFLPETSEKILGSIKREKDGIIVKKIDNLFPRLRVYL